MESEKRLARDLQNLKEDQETASYVHSTYSGSLQFTYIGHSQSTYLDISRQSETTTVSLMKYNEKEASDISLLASLIHSFQASFYPLVDWNQLTHEEYELAFEEKLERSARHTNQ